MSKIQSESNSQREPEDRSGEARCGSNVKDTIWKQFTTKPLTPQRPSVLWFQCQRYNLKAIHNNMGTFDRSGFVVVPMSKIQSESNSQLTSNNEAENLSCGSNVKDTIWKQFTTGTINWIKLSCCGSNVKDTIWKQFTTHSSFLLVDSSLWFQCQRYNLKAIHNGCQDFNFNTCVVVPMSKIQSESNSQQKCPGIIWRQVVVPMSKIQSESNSQRKLARSDLRGSCGSNVKDTIWKQFTTCWAMSSLTYLLWFQCQRYNLKAIHNSGGNTS